MYCSADSPSEGSQAVADGSNDTSSDGGGGATGGGEAAGVSINENLFTEDDLDDLDDELDEIDQ